CANAENQTVFAPVAYGNLTLSNSTGSGTSTKSITKNIAGISGNLNVNGFTTFDQGIFSANRIAAGGNLNLNGNAVLKLAGSKGGQTGSNFPKNFSTMSVSANSTVDYYSGNGIDQVVYGPVTYGHLSLSNITGSGLSVKS